MRFVKTLVVGVAAALLLWGPSVAMAATTMGGWIQEGPNNVGIYKTAQGYTEYIPSTKVARSDLVGGLAPDTSAPRAPMNAGQKETGARLARDFHRAFQAIGL